MDKVKNIELGIYIYDILLRILKENGSNWHWVHETIEGIFEGKKIGENVLELNFNDITGQFSSEEIHEYTILISELRKFYDEAVSPREMSIDERNAIEPLCVKVASSILRKIFPTGIPKHLNYRE